MNNSFSPRGLTYNFPTVNEAAVAKAKARELGAHVIDDDELPSKTLRVLVVGEVPSNVDEVLRRAGGQAANSA